MTRHAIALAGAAALLIAAPWVALSRRDPVPASPPPIDDRPLRAAPNAAIDPLLVREPFHLGGADATPEAGAETAGDDGAAEAPPAIVGVAGRLPDRAVVLVRREAGGTRSLAIGEALGRWRLESIAADAALFSDGAHRVRVELPIGDPPQ